MDPISNEIVVSKQKKKLIPWRCEPQGEKLKSILLRIIIHNKAHIARDGTSAFLWRCVFDDFFVQDEVKGYAMCKVQNLRSIFNGIMSKRSVQFNESEDGRGLDAVEDSISDVDKQVRQIMLDMEDFRREEPARKRKASAHQAEEFHQNEVIDTLHHQVSTSKKNARSLDSSLDLKPVGNASLNECLSEEDKDHSSLPTLPSIGIYSAGKSFDFKKEKYRILSHLRYITLEKFRIEQNIDEASMRTLEINIGMYVAVDNYLRQRDDVYKFKDIMCEFGLNALTCHKLYHYLEAVAEEVQEA